MNPNAIPETIEDPLYDEAYQANVLMLSKSERKRMMAREHNRAYNAGELNRPVDLVEIVRGAVSHAQHSLGMPVTQSVLSKNR